MNILDRVFPKQITNNYKGSKIALIVFMVITAVTIVRSCIHIFAPDGGAQSIAGFPLNTYALDAGKLVILTFSLWGASQLLMGIVYVVVLIRYKSLIPFMYILIVIEYTTRLFLGFYKPAISAHVVPGGVLDYVMIPVAVTMFVLSIWHSNEKHLSL